MSAANRRSAAARHSGSDQRQAHDLPLRLSETIPTTVTGLSSFSLQVWRVGAGEPWIPALSCTCQPINGFTHALLGR